MPRFYCRIVGATMFALSFVASLSADVILAPLFRDGAVLQREQSLPVWGKASPGEKVLVRFHRQSAETVAGTDGRWKVVLEPEKACSDAAELIVAGTNTVHVRDVLVGDVWLCSGQSNMEFRVSQARDAERETAAATMPLIRHFKIPHLVAEKPADDCPGKWEPCSPATVGEFTAVGYFFAKDLHARLGVPIGLVNSSWGGTQIEGWMNASAVASDPSAKAIDQRWRQVLADYPGKLEKYERDLAKWNKDEAAARASGKDYKKRKPVAPEGSGSRWLPSGMFNAMIAPLAPAAFRGVLWYQGEANAARYEEYRSLFPGMIRQWRESFGRPELPFYFVQLANLERRADTSGSQWAFQREAQAAALTLPATGMAVTIDIGDATNIHPTNKQEVGRRLALIARAQLFGEPVEFTGPVFEGAQRVGSSLRVTFVHAAGLRMDKSVAAGFEVAGEDRKFVPAVVTVDGEALLLSAPGVSAPVAVRYAWGNNPSISLFNGAGLPAAPFRSDRW
jgi:sialate O-acetylesterase